MAPRIRSVKPEQTKDEALAALSVWARMLFAYLPCHADREGRLEDRPRVIKLEIFPWDDVDVNALLEELAPKFVVRYAVGDRKYIQIRTFLKHQRPNNRELPSQIPAPTEDQLNASKEEKKGYIAPFIQKKAPLIQNEGIREGVGKVEGRYVAPMAQEAEVLPDLTPLQIVVRAFKLAKGVDPDDAGWDTKHYKRHVRPAKELLTVFDGNSDRAAQYLLEKGREWEHLTDWGIEAILKAAGREAAKLSEGNNGPTNGKMDNRSNDEPRRISRTASAGDLAGDTLRRIENAPIYSQENGDLEDEPF